MPSPTPSAANLAGPLAETVKPSATARQRPAGPAGSERTMSVGSSSSASSSAGSSHVEDFELSSVRFNWQLEHN